MSAELAEAPPQRREGPPPAPVRPRTEGPRNPEREPLGANPFVAVEGRIILSGENLNPNKKDVRPPTVDDLNKALNYDPFRGASMAERREQAQGDVNNWISETTSRFQGSKDFFNDSKDGSQGQRWSAFFGAMGINAKEFTEEDAKKFYEEHFAKGKDQGESLAKKIAEASGYDLKTFEKNHDVISWLGAMVGKDGKVALESYARVEIRKHERNAESRQQWLEEMAQDDRINKLGTEQPDEKYGHLTELQLDEYLWKGKQKADEAKAAAVQPPNEHGSDHSGEHDNSGAQEVLPSGEYSLKQIFEKVKGPVVTSQEYFVANPPDEIKTEGQNLKLIKPLYINVRIEDGALNGNLNPEAKPFFKALEHNARYENGEALTDGDSSLVGIAAASSPDAEHQAKLYGDLAKAVLSMHQQDEKIVGEWLKAQYQSEGDKANTLAFLKHFDSEKTDPNGKLLVLNPDGNIDAAGFDAQWKTRIAELQDAIAHDKLKDYHLRWIEFLSHSVDVNKLMKLAKDQQPAAPAGHDTPAPDHGTPPPGDHGTPDDHSAPADGHGGGHDTPPAEEKKKGLWSRIADKFKRGNQKVKEKLDPDAPRTNPPSHTDEGDEHHDPAAQGH